jgi:hypothetical protein
MSYGSMMHCNEPPGAFMASAREAMQGVTHLAGVVYRASRLRAPSGRLSRSDSIQMNDTQTLLALYHETLCRLIHLYVAKHHATICGHRDPKRLSPTCSWTLPLATDLDTIVLSCVCLLHVRMSYLLAHYAIFDSPPVLSSLPRMHGPHTFRDSGTMAMEMVSYRV